MDQLVKQISERVGIPEDQAREAVTMTIAFVKDKLPPQLAAQLDGILAGQVNEDTINQVSGMLGGMFGKK